MARSVTVCIDTNVLLGFFNDEPDKVESCAAFFQLLFTRRIKSVVSTITLMELAAILTAADKYAIGAAPKPRFTLNCYLALSFLPLL